MGYNYPKICQKVLSGLPPRQKEVIERRFGLPHGRQRETLESIGESFGVTRERIRQLENDGFLRLAKCEKTKDLTSAFDYFAEHLKKQGGAQREDILFKHLAKEQEQNDVQFLFTLGETFHRFPESDALYPFWAIDQGLFEEIEQVVSTILKKLEQDNKPLPLVNLLSSVKAKPSTTFLSCLSIAKQVEMGPLGEYGLIAWPEIRPRGVRDKAYLALKKQQKPLHFQAITEAINHLLNFSDIAELREAKPQTVHNELIKDERFVLVGRGVYGLKDWGYQDGTVKDVIASVLKQTQKPLSRQEVIEKVSAQRFVKMSTILLNLNNKKYFSRDNQGGYTLKL